MRKQEDVRGGVGRRAPSTATTPTGTTPANVNNANSNIGVLALLQSVCGGDNPEALVRQLRLPQLPAKNGIKSCACIVHLILLQVSLEGIEICASKINIPSCKK